jgi:predicted transcriptional regulator of viral defense system
MTKTEQALALVKGIGIARPKDLAPRGIAPVYLRRLVKAGQLVQSARGLYKLAGQEETPHHRLADACKLVPNSVVCLLSALHFHDLAKQPPAVWLAIDRKARKPTIERLRIRFVRFSGAALRGGVEDHTVEGVSVRITSCSKTVADCFKYRRKIGLDVALDALRACLRKRRCSKGELLRSAEVCRIFSVIHPYVEALT